MAGTIRLFMWGFQKQFLNDIKSAAQRLISLLDKEAEFEVFLLGAQVERKRGFDHLICLEPEEGAFAPEDFSDVLADLEHFKNIDAQRLASHPVAGKNLKRKIYQRAWKQAVLKACQRRGRGEYFCSHPEMVNGYQVAILLNVKFKEKAPYRVPKVHVDEEDEIHRSLFDTTINRFLSRCVSSLYAPAPDEVSRINADRAEELLHQSGKELMELPALAAGGERAQHGTFSMCEEISSLKYEGADAKSGLVFARESHPNIAVEFKLQVPISKQEHRSIRKLLEVAKGDRKLLCDGKTIYGIGRLTGEYDASQADLYEVNFGKHRSWTLSHANHILAKVEHGLVHMPQWRLKQEQFEADICGVLKQVDKNPQLLYQLALKASEQRKGTMLVIHPHAEAEAQRLSSQATLLVPLHLTPDQVEAVTSIDGAVLLCPQGVCFAIGAILDGTAVMMGDRSRGARYNSAMKYVASQGGKCIALVFSEDGDVNVISASGNGSSKEKV